MITLHGKEIMKDDMVWHSRLGFMKIGSTNTDKGNSYPIRLEDGTSFTSNGKIAVGDIFPTLFWKEQTIDLSQPLPKLKVDANIIVWGTTGLKVRRHFSHFDKDGDIQVFVNGKTSFTAEGNTITFDNWEVHRTI